MSSVGLLSSRNCSIMVSGFDEVDCNPRLDTPASALRSQEMPWERASISNCANRIAVIARAAVWITNVIINLASLRRLQNANIMNNSLANYQQIHVSPKQKCFVFPSNVCSIKRALYRPSFLFLIRGNRPTTNSTAATIVAHRRMCRTLLLNAVCVARQIVAADATMMM